MSRALTSGFITAATGKVSRPFFLFEGQFVSYTLRLWTGFGDLSWNSQTWLGNGWLQGIEGVEESDDIGTTGMTITLAGIPLTLISTVLGDAKQGASGKLYLGFLDSSSAVIADPYLMFDGKLDVPTIDDRVEGPVITISYESKLVDLDRTREFRYTPESQHIFAPADKGFDYVAALQDWTGQWGPKKKDHKKKERPAVKKKGGGQRGGAHRK